MAEVFLSLDLGTRTGVRSEPRIRGVAVSWWWLDSIPLGIGVKVYSTHVRLGGKLACASVG